MSEKTVRILQPSGLSYPMNAFYGIHPNTLEPVENADAEWVQKWLGVGVEWANGPLGTEVTWFQVGGVERGDPNIAFVQRVCVSVN